MRKHVHLRMRESACFNSTCTRWTCAAFTSSVEKMKYVAFVLTSSRGTIATVETCPGGPRCVKAYVLVPSRAVVSHLIGRD